MSGLEILAMLAVMALSYVLIFEVPEMIKEKRWRERAAKSRQEEAAAKVARERQNEGYEVVEYYLANIATIDDGFRRLFEIANKGEIRFVNFDEAIQWIVEHPDAQLGHDIICSELVKGEGDRSTSSYAFVFNRHGWTGNRKGSVSLVETITNVSPKSSWLVFCKSQIDQWQERGTLDDQDG